MCYLLRMPRLPEKDAPRNVADELKALRQAFRARASQLRDETAGHIIGDSADIIHENRDNR
jgi:hypothetical protein